MRAAGSIPAGEGWGVFRLGDGASWVIVVLVLLVGIVIGSGLRGGSTPAEPSSPSPSPWQPPIVVETTQPAIHIPDSYFELSASPSAS